MSEVGDLRRIQDEIDDVVESLQRTPVPKDAPIVYEENCITVYGTPEHYGGDAFYIEHTCRNDLGVVLVKEHSALHPLLQELKLDE